MKRSRKRLASLFLAAGTLLLGVAAGAQPVEGDLVFESLDVRVVNVEVFVSDRKGRALLDLARDDFRVFVDDREVELSHFASPGGRTAGSTEDADASTAAAEVRPGETAPLLVVLYIDNSTLLEARREILVQHLRRLAAASDPGELRFALVTFDSKLQWRTGFLTELGSLDEALEQLAGEPSAGVDLVLGYRRSVSDIRGIVEGFAQTDCDPCDCGWDAMTGAWEQYASRTAEKVGATSVGLLQLVRSLSGLPGRKAVVYLSPGLEQRPGLSLAAYLADLCPAAENILEFQTDRQVRYDETETLAALSAEANAGRISLYPLQVGSMDRDSGLPGFARLDREGNLRDGLRFLAGETGGELLFDAGRLFETLDSDVSEGYELAFTPEHPADGRTHRIRVELRSPKRGVELRYRQSYRDKPPAERLVDRAHAVLNLGDGAGLENPLGVEAQIRTAPTPELELTLPVALLTQLPSAEAPSPPARVRLFLLIRNSSAGVLPVLQKAIEVPVGAEPNHRIVVGLNLPPGPSEVVVGVRDEVGGVTSFVKLLAEP